MVGPDYQTPKASVAGAWTPSPALTNRPSGDADVYWWRNLNDPVLDRLVQTASSNNLSLQSAGARILQTRAQLSYSIGKLFPQQQNISAGVNYDRLPTDLTSKVPGLNPDLGTDQILFGATWEIDFWGKYRRGIQSDLRVSLSDKHLRVCQRLRMVWNEHTGTESRNGGRPAELNDIQEVPEPGFLISMCSVVVTFCQVFAAQGLKRCFREK